MEEKELYYEDLLLIDFFAEWCEPCKWLNPILKEVEENIPNNFKILKLDIDKYPELAGKYNIQSVPALLLLRKGKVIWREVGILLAPELTRIIQAFIK